MVGDDGCLDPRHEFLHIRTRDHSNALAAPLRKHVPADQIVGLLPTAVVFLGVFLDVAFRDGVERDGFAACRLPLVGLRVDDLIDLYTQFSGLLARPSRPWASASPMVYHLVLPANA